MAGVVFCPRIVTHLTPLPSAPTSSRFALTEKNKGEVKIETDCAPPSARVSASFIPYVAPVSDSGPCRLCTRPVRPALNSGFSTDRTQSTPALHRLRLCPTVLRCALLCAEGERDPYVWGGVH